MIAKPGKLWELVMWVRALVYGVGGAGCKGLIREERFEE